MTNGAPDPLAEAEHEIYRMHETARTRFGFMRRRYPLLFLFLLTFSVAAIFHGFDKIIEQLDPTNQYPLAIIACGILGLFITGSLYTRLGKDKYE